MLINELELCLIERYFSYGGKMLHVSDLIVWLYVCVCARTCSTSGIVVLFLLTSGPEIFFSLDDFVAVQHISPNRSDYNVSLIKIKCTVVIT